MLTAITSALFVAGAVVAAPAAVTTPYPQTCGQRAQHITAWAVKDFDFHASYTFSTPAHQNSWGYVNFTLQNAAVDYVAQCEGSSNQLSDFFYGNMIYQCKLPVSESVASFTFSRPSGALNINQTWSCPMEGSRFYAQGGTTLNLSCANETWQNPDWKIGQIYSSRTVTCKHVDAPVPIKAMQAVA